MMTGGSLLVENSTAGESDSAVILQEVPLIADLQREPIDWRYIGHV